MTQANLRLHLGTHKTATTYLQKLLSINADYILNVVDIAYLPMPVARKIITPYLWKENHDISRIMQNDIQTNIENWLEQRYKRTCFATLLISEENFIGNCGQIVNTGLLYPKIRLRCQKLFHAFADTHITVFLSIRDYADFLVSAYCEHIRFTKNFIRFDEFKAKINLQKRRWPAVVHDILKVFPETLLYLWLYEDFRKNETLIVDQLLGCPVSNLHPVPQNVVRPSSSRQAIEVLHLINVHAGPEVAANMVSSIEKLLPKTPKLDSYDPWNSNERRNMHALYEQDLNLLRNMPNVQFITP